MQLSAAWVQVLGSKAGEGGLSRYEFTNFISTCGAARMFPTWGARGMGLSSSRCWSAEEEIDLLKVKWSRRGMGFSVGFSGILSSCKE